MSTPRDREPDSGSGWDSGSDSDSGSGSDSDSGAPGADDVVIVPITDELDLHAFAPREVADVVAEYLDAARERGFEVVRIVHGKGSGALRRTVHAVLDRHHAVRGYHTGGDREGGWGSTIVELHAPSR
ncbi:MAG TPA: Smr/MutS family protein [Kofleriaceae bacterium]|nr:Smr/MutS family protein [Kofleriaceae bacterium]